MSRRVGLGRHGRIEDRAGDPLEGLVNLFDIGIVLAVAFLIAGLTLSVSGEGKIEKRAAAQRPQKVKVLERPSGSPRARGRGEPVGRVYRLADGRLIYVNER